MTPVFIEAKEIIEGANNLQQLKEVAYDRLRRLNPMNGEREDLMGLIIDIAHGFGKSKATKTFRLYWLTGTSGTVKGEDFADAMNKAGFGGGAIGALDFFTEKEELEYIWDKEKRNWEKK